jgi:transcriptional regulator with GAF, ATPase, and Fis domain
MKKVLRLVEQVAPTDSSVLICGETGTGKELIAQEIHQLGPRRDHVMVKVNCAALPSGLVESELFGREKGAYTGALTRQIGLCLAFVSSRRRRRRQAHHARGRLPGPEREL